MIQVVTAVKRVFVQCLYPKCVIGCTQFKVFLSWLGCGMSVIFFCNDHFTFVYHVHQFDIRQHIAGRAKGFKVEHRSGHAFDGTMILLDDVVEIFD